MTEHNQRLTKEFLQKNNVVFHPRTREEATVVLKNLFKMDFAWANGHTEVGWLKESIAGGILILDGKIYHGPDPARKYIVCDVAQLDGNWVPFEERVMALFNEQAERQKRIEEKLDRLLAEIEPKEIDKPKSLKTSFRP